METVIVKFPDYYQEHLPESQRTFHFEVRRNYGTHLCSNWQTIKYSDSEEEANEWVSTN